MNARTITLQVADDGTLTLPVDLIRVLQLSPCQTIVAEAQQDALVLKPSRQEHLDRIGRLLSTALAGVEWPEIEAGRCDRCFSA